MIKPAILDKIEQIQKLDLGMTIVAVAESKVIDQCQTWMNLQPDLQDIEAKTYCVYKGVPIVPATAPLGGPGYVVQTRTLNL